jgi:hypothetical protein
MLDVPARLADGGGDSGVDRWRSRDSVQQQERKAESLAVRGSFTAAGADIHMTLELRLNDFRMSESSPQRRVADAAATRDSIRQCDDARMDSACRRRRVGRREPGGHPMYDAGTVSSARLRPGAIKDRALL